MVNELQDELDLSNTKVKNLTLEIGQSRQQEDKLLKKLKEMEQMHDILKRDLQREKENASKAQQQLMQSEQQRKLSNTPHLKQQKSTEPKIESKNNSHNIDINNNEIISSIYTKKDILPYTTAVDKLLDESRKQRGPSPNILIAMKAIVVSCKSITQICENFEAEEQLIDLEMQEIEESKTKLSQSLTNVMGIVKELSTKDPSSSSVDRIYNAICDLTSVVINLVTTVNNLLPGEEEEDFVQQPQRSVTQRYSIPELKVLLINSYSLKLKLTK